MRRFLLCSLVLAACRFSAPANPDGGDDGGDDAPVDPDAAERRCDLAPTWDAGLQPVRTLHVAPTTTGTPDGTQQHPFTSIAAAVMVAKTPAAGPGTRILLEGGTYTMGGATIADLRGTATAPFWIEGPSSGTRALIMGGTTGIHLVRPAYVVVRHLDIQSVTQAGFNADDGGTGTGPAAHHVVAEDVNISILTTSAFQITGVTDVDIRDSSATSANRGVMLVGVQRATIARFQASSMAFAGVVMGGGSSEIDVRQSSFSSITSLGIWMGGASDSNEFRPALSPAGNNYEVTDVRVFDNVFNDMQDGITCNNCRRALVAHNEIRGATRFVFRLSQDRASVDTFNFGPPGAVRWINNAIEAPVIASALGTFAAVGGAIDLASCEVSHNLWYRMNPAASWTPTFPAPLAETMGIYTRPSGYDATGRLCSGGGAAGAGLVLPEVTGTLEGTCRPAPPAPPSIGPSERDPGC